MPKKVYKVSYRHGWRLGNVKIYHVLAKDAAQAVDHVRRYTKKSYIGDGEISVLEKVVEIDIAYRT